MIQTLPPSMAPAGPAVAPARTHERPRLLRTLTLAFAADPAVRWMYPDAAQYQQYFPEFARAFGGAAVEHGTALRDEGCNAVALWLPPDGQPDEEALATLLARSVAADRRPHIFTLLERMDACHPREPHWYLPLIGVDPARQGSGLGTALLRSALDRCDRTGLPAYLESTNPRNISLYHRHGFEVVDAITVADCPPVVPMLRRPEQHRRAPTA